MPYERRNWREALSLSKVNFVIRILTISDIFMLSAFGLVSPILSIFYLQNIHGAGIETAGLASTIYLLTRSLCQLPVAHFIDKIKGERDDVFIMVVGSFLTSFVPLLYIVIRTPAQLYLTQFFYGLAQACTYPSWLALFTRHIDRDKTGLEWGIYYTLTDLSGAAVAAVGGILAQRLGFAPLFVVVSIISFFGAGWLLALRFEMDRERKSS